MGPAFWQMLLYKYDEWIYVIMLKDKNTLLLPGKNILMVAF